MGIYVTLVNYTEQGIKGIKERHSPATSMSATTEAKGIKVLSGHVTMGQYDEIFTWEAPDDETAAWFLLTWGKRGNVKTTTLKAFTVEQFRKIADTLA